MYPVKKSYLFTTLFVLCIAIGSIMYWRYTRIYTVEDYNKWLNNSSNGCIVNNEIAGVKVTIKYQPPSYQVFKEMQNMSKAESKIIDSLLNIQNTMLTFLMTIEPDKESGKPKRNSVMYEGVEDYSQYVQRVMSTNFLMDQYISLYIDNAEYKPVLTNMENVYEMSDDRNFIIVFANSMKKSLAGKDVTFVYNDQFFNLGKVQFNFSGKDLEKAKKLNVVWN